VSISKELAKLVIGADCYCPEPPSDDARRALREAADEVFTSATDAAREDDLRSAALALPGGAGAGTGTARLLEETTSHGEVDREEHRARERPHSLEEAAADLFEPDAAAGSAASETKGAARAGGTASSGGQNAAAKPSRRALLFGGLVGLPPCPPARCE